MQGRTHRVGGVLCALLGYTFLEANGMLIPDVEPLVQLTVVYPFAMYGAVVSDLDHHWESTPSKDPISWIINKILHLTSKMPMRSKILNVFDAKQNALIGDFFESFGMQDAQAGEQLIERYILLFEG